jgi:hypothetical protein
MTAKRLPRISAKFESTRGSEADPLPFLTEKEFVCPLPLDLGTGRLGESCLGATLLSRWAQVINNGLFKMCCKWSTGQRWPSTSQHWAVLAGQTGPIPLFWGDLPCPYRHCPGSDSVGLPLGPQHENLDGAVPEARMVKSLWDLLAGHARCIHQGEKEPVASLRAPLMSQQERRRREWKRIMICEDCRV